MDYRPMRMKYVGRGLTSRDQTNNVLVFHHDIYVEEDLLTGGFRICMTCFIFSDLQLDLRCLM